MLEILYQDEVLVAVNKPAGMLVHRSWLDRHETQFVMQTLRDQIGQLVYPIHRLDRPTSGVLLFALNSEIANLLCQQFEQKQIEKQYLAVVRGYVTGHGEIDYPLKVQLDKIADKFSQPDKAPQSAVTFYEGLQTVEMPNRALMEHTGCARLLLHAEKLTFVHPLTQRPMTIQAGLDAQWQNLMQTFQW